MRFFTVVITLLCLVVATLSAPTSDELAEGTYVIFNRVLSPTGQQLAITFNGKGQAATLTSDTKANSQRWILKSSGPKTMSVTPVEATNLQAAWGNGIVTVVPAHNYVWTIKSTNTGYTIQDGGETVFWGANQATTGQDVTIGGGTGDETQRWIFQKSK